MRAEKKMNFFLMNTTYATRYPQAFGASDDNLELYLGAGRSRVCD